MYKINVAASFRVSTQAGGWGFVARNNNGEFLERGYGKSERVSSPLQAEAQAALVSLRRVAELGMSRIVLETDAANLQKGLTSTELDRSVDGCLFRQIRNFISESFVQCVIRACPRSCNKVVDCLASYGASVARSGSGVYEPSPRLCNCSGLWRFA